MNPVLSLATLLLGYADKPQSNPVLNEMAEAQKSCGIDGITYVQFSGELREVYILISNRLHSRRKELPVAAGVACSTKIVVDRGYKPIVLGTKK